MNRQFPELPASGGKSIGKLTRISAAASAIGLGALAAWDLTQKKHSILRNYPIAGLES